VWYVVSMPAASTSRALMDCSCLFHHAPTADCLLVGATSGRCFKRHCRSARASIKTFSKSRLSGRTARKTSGPHCGRHATSTAATLRVVAVDAARSVRRGSVQQTVHGLYAARNGTGLYGVLAREHCPRNGQAKSLSTSNRLMCVPSLSTRLVV
jgi:hypothetical protein